MSDERAPRGVLTAERLKEIQDRVEAAKSQCMCAVCLLDNERRYAVDCIECDRAREYHKRDDVPDLLAALIAALARVSELEKEQREHLCSATPMVRGMMSGISATWREDVARLTAERDEWLATAKDSQSQYRKMELENDSLRAQNARLVEAANGVFDWINAERLRRENPEHPCVKLYDALKAHRGEAT